MTWLNHHPQDIIFHKANEPLFSLFGYPDDKKRAKPLSLPRRKNIFINLHVNKKQPRRGVQMIIPWLAVRARTRHFNGGRETGRKKIK